jgi:RND family efflux transporter MFP subunit
VELAFRVPGVLIELPVREGDRVAKGDLIAKLRQDEFQARLTSLQGQLDEARASLRALQSGERPEEILRREADVRSAAARLANARADQRRSEQLRARGAVTQAELERTETLLTVAQEDYTSANKILNQSTVGREEDIEAMEGRVRALEGNLVGAQVQLSDATLLAPYDGVIAQRFVDEQQNIQPNTPVVQFQDAEEIDIAVDVPETIMVADIQRAEILSMTAELSAAPGVSFPVRLREIAQVADPVAQTFRIRVAMAAPPEMRILPGMSANVTVNYQRASILGSQTLIPIQAVSETPDGKQVAWVMTEDDTVESRPIVVGETLGGELEVLEGLAPGDRIVIAGVRFLRDGMKVRDLGNSLGGGQS